MRNGWNRMGLGLAAAVFLLGLAAAEEAPAGADERMGRRYVLMT